MNTGSRRIFGVLVLFVMFLFMSCVILEQAAHARAGGGRSSGSRSYSTGSRSTGSSTYGTSSPYRSTNPTAQPTRPQSNPYSPGRSFLYGLGGGMVGSMIGSMLFGRSGYGGMGGAGGGGFGFGDIIILAIIIGIIYFVYKRFKARKEMQMSGASAAGYNSYAYNEPAYDDTRYDQPYNQQPAGGQTIDDGLRHIASMDPAFNETGFRGEAEDLFFKIQGGWTRRDIAAISGLLTPQMRDTFEADIARYIADKKINRLENIAVRQVDIVEAIQDKGEEFITVKYTASLLDFIADETGNVISGSPTDPVKFLEYWTYSRKVGERVWKLAAITQEQDWR